MATGSQKYGGKSKKYIYVYIMDRIAGKTTYTGQVGKYKKQGFKTERDAALWVDKRLIEAGKEPVNILVRK